jgi:hypothetical protein
MKFFLLCSASFASTYTQLFEEPSIFVGTVPEPIAQIGITVDGKDVIYITDTLKHGIVTIYPNGTQSILTGGKGVGESDDQPNFNWASLHIIRFLFLP